METNTEYHADTDHIGSSMLRDATESLDKFRRLHIDKTEQKEETDAMRFGTLFHTAVLEPERLDLDYIIEPDWNAIIRKKDGGQYASVRSTKDFKAAYAEWLEENGTRQPVTAENMASAVAMALAVNRNNVARSTIKMCDHTETSIRWDVEGTQFKGKCRPDKHGVDMGIIVDLKSAEEPTPGPWDRKSFDFGYHQQAAWYIDGLTAETGIKSWVFYFIVVGKKPPRNVYVRQLSQDAIDIGRRINNETLDQLQAATEYNDWRQPEEKEVTEIIKPAWVK
ncbi:MAG: hypothetical protein GY841_18530 [FCB group bacterium]|nr:hypothetical protein [FCB group bacterium]